MRKLKCTFLVLLIVSFLPVFAQKAITVRGFVKETRINDWAIGANVIVKGTTNGVVVGVTGQYVIHNVPDNAVLVFSSIGMKTQEIPVNGRTTINVSLAEESKLMDEVVVVGYGTSRKRDLTGSIISVKGDDLKASPDNNPVKSLQGKVPGLLVTNSGGAGSTPSIRLRGVATVNASTNPLYVVDGMFVDNIDFVNPNDIKSIEVLKDPSSLAIFGVQGANGVILISTRKAKEGTLTVNYDGYAGVQYLHNRDRLKLTDASEFTMLYNEKLKNENSIAQEWTPDLLGKGTDWQNEIFRPAFITNHGISVSNSNEKASSLLSLGYFKQDGVVDDNAYQRFNGRWMGDYKISKNLKVGSNITATRWDSRGASVSVQNAARAIPTYTPYAPKEDWNDQNIGSHFTPSPSIQKDVANPVAVMEINRGNSESYGYRAVGNIYAEIKFLKDFTFKATGYGDIGVSFANAYTPKFDVNNENSNSSHKSEKTSFRRNADEYTKYQADFLLNYSKQVKEHRIGAMAGYTARKEVGKGFNASVDSLVNSEIWNVPDDFWMLSVGSPTTFNAGDWFNEESFISYLARVNYSYADKYLLTATFRADGSSKFSPNKRWGYFPSVGLGWVISQEEFMEPVKDKFDMLKLRGSWGKLGNDKIGNYLWFPTINPTGQQVIIDGKVYYIPTVSNYVDANVHWEIVTGTDIGIEGVMFDGRFNFDLGYFNKKTSDLLAYVAPPVSVGVGYAITNAGSIKNSGFEFVLGWKDKVNDFSYGVSVNGATLKNKVLSLGNDNSDIVTGTYHRTTVGQSVGAMYGYVQDGIFQNQAEIDSYYSTPWKLQPGDIRYKDVNGDQKIDEKDRTFIGTSIPSFSYGVNLNFGYKNFDLSLDFNGVYGNEIINTKKLPSFTQLNYYKTDLNRWHGEGTSNVNPILDNTRAHNYLPSTNLLEDGSYLRLRSIQFGYTLPRKVLNSMQLSNFRVFANIQNPLTFKKNSGYTPEIGGGILDGGVDGGGTYPLPTVYTAGLAISF